MSRWLKIVRNQETLCNLVADEQITGRLLTAPRLFFVSLQSSEQYHQPVLEALSCIS